MRESRKKIHQRCAKYRQNICASPKLYHMALQGKKRKWGFFFGNFPQKNFEPLHISNFKKSRGKEYLWKSFGLQWDEKQKLKTHYQIPRKNAWSKKISSSFSPDNFELPQKSLAFLSHWESRLDICLWKAAFFSSIAQSRQAIRHGLVKVDGKKVKKSARLLREGELVSLDFKENLALSKKNLMQKNLLNQKDLPFQLPSPPYHLEVSYSNFQFVFIHKPEIIK